MILDTKESGVKTITSQAQRVRLPRLFDAILQILFLLACVASGVSGACEMVETFVLDFSDAYWQIPIHKAEQQFFCATIAIECKDWNLWNLCIHKFNHLPRADIFVLAVWFEPVRCTSLIVGISKVNQRIG